MFLDTVRGRNGGRLPLNLDNTRHDCSARPYSKPEHKIDEQIKSDLERLITTINLLTEAKRFRLVTEDKA